MRETQRDKQRETGKQRQGQRQRDELQDCFFPLSKSLQKREDASKFLFLWFWSEVSKKYEDEYSYFAIEKLEVFQRLKNISLTKFSSMILVRILVLFKPVS
jgi:hypothetical protein